MYRIPPLDFILFGISKTIFNQKVTCLVKKSGDWLFNNVKVPNTSEVHLKPVKMINFMFLKKF